MVPQVVVEEAEGPKEQEHEEDDDEHHESLPKQVPEAPPLGAVLVR